MTNLVTRPGPGLGDTTADLPTLLHVLRHHAAELSDRHALTFLLDGETKEARFDFAELDLRARAVAASLAEHVSPGGRALLLFPPGVDYIMAFLGCLYAGVIAVPAYPPDPSPLRLKRTLPRLQAIVADAGATAVLTTTGIAKMSRALFGLAPEFAELDWIATDTADLERAGDWLEPDLTADSIAFLQYTSGSTGAPKGVMLTHGNLLAQAEILRAKYQHTADSVACHWLPPYHDMGLIGAILTPLHNAFPTIVMSPMAFLRKPIRWVQAISRISEGTVTAGGPNFAFDLCVRKSTPEQRAALDLSNWRVAYTGAEPIRPATLDRFAAAFEVSGFQPKAFFPCYGLAEATLLVTGADPGTGATRETFSAAALERREVAPPTEGDARELVSCGTAGDGLDLRVVDPETGAELSSNKVGELWVRGPVCAKGYWEKAELSQATFAAHLPGEGGARGDGPFMRTGDLAFKRGEEVYIAGRIKDMIIIRGANYYPQDIEEVVEGAHAMVRKGCVAAFSYDAGEEERLGVVTEVDMRTEPDPQEILDAITKAVVSAYQVAPEAVVLIAAKTIPKTSSGKIQRFASRRGFLDGTLDEVARRVG